MKQLVREKYLSRIRPFFHDDMIKVLTGVRRCGKSTIMEQIRDELLRNGINGDNIVYLNLDLKRYRRIKTPDELERIIDSLVNAKEGMRYLFIDEIQNVSNFEEIINSYREEGFSIFITGSNSYLLSGELVTKLTGRYLEFRIMPFTLSEIRDYLTMNGYEFDSKKEFNDYLRYGGYPKRLQYEDTEAKGLYIRSVIEESMTKDILRNRNVRNKGLMERILRLLFSTPGMTISSNSIADYLKSEHVITQYQTVIKYLDLILSSGLASKCERFDIVGKKSLKTLYKSYVADPALYTLYPADRHELRMGALIENIVHIELISRGYAVSVGRFRKHEVDFVVKKGAQVGYIQVSFTLSDSATEEREKAPLLRIEDGFPKYIITMDPIAMDTDGIHVLNLMDDFLLGDGFSL